ncbi:MAG TPA: hypothetical protein VFV28_00695 [Limnobacter sp.]|nr:hypothetical protein [Limnobacter sp.]
MMRVRQLLERGLQHMLIALAVLLAQWAGVAHSIEHREQLHAESTAHSPASSDLLHSCLLFDGLTTASSAVSHPPQQAQAPRQCSLQVSAFEESPPRNSLFAQRVRVRDPPLFS